MSITVKDAVDVFLAHRKPRVLPTSYYTYSFWLSRWLRWREDTRQPEELVAVTLADLQAYFAHMLDVDGLAPASRDASWRIIKALWRLLARRKMLSDLQLSFFGEDGLARVTVPDDILPVYTEETIRALLAACDKLTDELWAARNRALIYLLWESGARASELCSLTDEMTSLEDRRGVIMGKGGKPRWLFWDAGANSAIEAYLDVRQGPLGGPLLRDGRAGGPMTYTAILGILRRTAKRAGVGLIKQSPVHSFRRTFAQDALESGIADLELQQLMGHRSIISTMRYTRRAPERLASVYSRMRQGRKERRGWCDSNARPTT